jgi:hypothetical protein
MIEYAKLVGYREIKREKPFLEVSGAETILSMIRKD